MKESPASESNNYSWNMQLRDWISSPLGIAAMSCFVVYLAYMKIRSQQYPTYDDDDYEDQVEVPMREPLKNLKLTKEQLSEYNATNRKGTYLIALLGLIYDVSNSPKDFGPNGSYKCLSGTDIMDWIRGRAEFEQEPLQKLVDEWQGVLEDHFFVAGELISDSDEDEDEDENKSNDTDDNSSYNSANDEDESKDIRFPGDATLLDSSIYNAEEGDSTLLAPPDVDQTLTNWNELDQTVIQAQK